MYTEFSTDQESVVNLPPFCNQRIMECEWKIVPARKGHCDGPMCCKFGLRCRDFAEGHCSFLHPGEEPGYPGPPFVQTKSQAKKRRAAADAAARMAFMEAFPSVGGAPVKVATPPARLSYASMAAKPAAPMVPAKPVILIASLPSDVGCIIDPVRSAVTAAVAAAAARASRWTAAEDVW